MKNKKNALGLCLIIVFALSLSVPVKAQQYSIKDRWNVKLGYSGYPCLGINFDYEKEITPTFQAEVNYGILNFLEAGVYTGYCSIKINSDITDMYSNTLKANTLFYGVNANIHLLPFLLKKERFRIDFYVSGKYGGFFRFAETDSSPKRGNTLDYGLYAGTAFYPGEHWGLYGEYGLGNYTNYRFGLSFKF